MTLAQGNASTTSVDMEGVTITMVEYYPEALSIDNALQDITGFGFTSTATVATFETNGGTSPNCTVTYTEPVAAGDAPVVSISTSGC